MGIHKLQRQFKYVPNEHDTDRTDELTLSRHSNRHLGFFGCDDLDVIRDLNA